MKYITLVMLTRSKACVDQKLLFKSTFGLRAELTEANMTKAIGAGLDFVWLTRLLPHKVYEAQYVALWKAYWEAYKAQCDSLWKAYGVQRNTLLLNALIAA